MISKTPFYPDSYRDKKGFLLLKYFETQGAGFGISACTSFIALTTS
jgi:hypothetical protein